MRNSAMNARRQDERPRPVEVSRPWTEEVFVALYREHRALVFRFALHMSGSRDLAEDVTQDVFVALLRQAGAYDPQRGALSSYLLGIARHHVLRALGRRPQVPIDGRTGKATLPRALVCEPVAETDLARSSVVELVRDAVLSLPLHYREVIVLCDLQERTYEETAAALDLAAGTVRSRLHRGRALLAQKLRRLVATPSPAVAVAGVPSREM
jgi:RNA polymerase sigma-70 factor (ECF subfamily)